MLARLSPKYIRGKRANLFYKKKFSCGTYPVEYWVVVSDELERSKRFIDSKLGADEPTTDEEVSWDGLFCSVEGPPPVLIVHINAGSDPIDLIKALVHELAHACFWVMDWASINLTDATSEAYTHLIDKMVGDVFHWLATKKMIKL